ncbi:formyl transferase [SAR92 clade bacterium H455]|uniref:Formyl transferase n=1 Tax=SAR92 clade bacterium H455 TaxID=2974818 RepID=A0ABY5TNW1_9GAMM|nr:formyl transferase [SAR92 clade bacterium H455]
MKITLLCNRDLPSHIALSCLINGLAEHLPQHQLSILISEKVGADKVLPEPLMELAAFERELLEDGRPSFEQLAESAGCSLQGFVDLDNKLNTPAGIARIAATEPELIISVRFGLIIREAVIALPKYGVINLHSGLLPNYRGVMATFRAMQNNDSQIASTLHYIQDGGIDNGDIISISAIPLNRQKSYLLNVINLYVGGCQQILSAVSTLSAGQSLAADAQQQGAAYYSFPTQSELDAFAAAGGRLFDKADITALSPY